MRALETGHLRSRTTIGNSGGGGTRTERVAMRRLLWAGPVAVAMAVAATLVARAVAVAVLPPFDPLFVAMQAASVAIVASVLCAMAVPVFALVAWRSRRPLHTFRIVAAVALVLSWVPDLLLLPQPGTTVVGVVALMILHVVAAAALVWTLSTLSLEPLPSSSRRRRDGGAGSPTGSCYRCGVEPTIGRAPTCRSTSSSSSRCQNDATFPSLKPKSAMPSNVTSRPVGGMRRSVR